MVLKLYGSNVSHPVLRVAHILTEKSVPFEFVPVDLHTKEQKTPEYLQNHPFGQVPYIDDDGFILYESRAICKYIATKWKENGTPLVPDPADLQATALFDQALSIEQNNFEPLAWNIILEIKYKPRKGLKPDPATVQELIDKLEEKLSGYEAILSKQKYLAGETPTLADLYHLAWGTVLTEELGVNVLRDESKRPHVARWWKNVESCPSWQSVKNGV